MRFCDTTFYFCDADAFQALMNSELGVVKILQAGIQTSYIHGFDWFTPRITGLPSCLVPFLLCLDFWLSAFQYLAFSQRSEEW